MAKHAQQSLPSQAFFLTQRTAEIGNNEQIMRAPFFTKTRMAHFPATATTREIALANARVGQRQPVVKFECTSRFPLESFEARAEQTFGRRIGEPQRAVVVEREYGNIERGNYLGEQRFFPRPLGVARATCATAN